jgi:raffinose/stachyose/melibiose transport system permease protein
MTALSINKNRKGDHRVKKFYSNKLAIILFTLPALLVFTVMVFYPITQVFVKSFYNWNGLGSGTFIGFDNYIKLFDDTVFKISNKNAFIFSAFITIFQITLATFFALVVSNKRTKGRKFLRVSYWTQSWQPRLAICEN